MTICLRFSQECKARCVLFDLCCPLDLRFFNPFTMFCILHTCKEGRHDASVSHICGVHRPIMFALQSAAECVLSPYLQSLSSLCSVTASRLNIYQTECTKRVLSVHFVILSSTPCRDPRCSTNRNPTRWGEGRLITLTQSLEFYYFRTLKSPGSGFLLERDTCCLYKRF